MAAARRARRTRIEGLTELEWAFLTDSVPANTCCAEHWALQADDRFFRPDRPDVRGLWDAYGVEAVRHFVQSRPGCRPTLWWRFSAPERLRHRVGGTGTAFHEVQRRALRLRLGVPVDFVTAADVATWPGLAGHETDQADPPRFESQPAYLHRHGLLSAAQRIRLRPADLRPVAFGWTADDAGAPTYRGVEAAGLS